MIRLHNSQPKKRNLPMLFVFLLKQAQDIVWGEYIASYFLKAALCDDHYFEWSNKFHDV